MTGANGALVGDTFTRRWSLAKAPAASVLARGTLGDPHASFAQTGAVAELRPDREGAYHCVLETYDGCADPVARTFEVEVAWDEACVADADAAFYGYVVPLVVALALAALATLANLPPLRWTHPRQITLDALAVLASRDAAEERAAMVATSVVDAPRLAKEARRRREKAVETRKAARRACFDTLLRDKPFAWNKKNRGARASEEGALDDRGTNRPVGLERGEANANANAPNQRSNAAAVPPPRRGAVPMTERERLAASLLEPKATPLEKLDATLVLLAGFGASAYDLLTRGPRRLYLTCRTSLLRAYAWAFHVPGGWAGVLVRAYLIMELPALLSFAIRPGSLPFARDESAVTEAAFALFLPGLILGPNMTAPETYAATYAASFACVVAAAGGAIGFVLSRFAATFWDATWVVADTVEAGGVTLTMRQMADAERRKEAEAKIRARRVERHKTCGRCVPREVWSDGSDLDVARALEEHFELPAARRFLEEDEDEEGRIESWARVGMRARRFARTLDAFGAFFAGAGSGCVAALATVGFFPATHAGLATALPSATDHGRPWAHVAFDPEVFYASPEHEGLVIVGLSVVFCAFCCAVVHHASTETHVPSARPQRLFELLAACAKLVLTFVGVAWEARLGKEPVRSARAGVIFWAYAHDATLAGVSLALLAAHVATQSVRGDAAGWNQWRAGTFAASAWVGAVSLAAKVVGGFDPANALPFMHPPGVPGGDPPTLRGGGGSSDTTDAFGYDAGGAARWRLLAAATAGGVRTRRVGQRRVLRARLFAAERGGVEPRREKEGGDRRWRIGRRPEDR